MSRVVTPRQSRLLPTKRLRHCDAAGPDASVSSPELGKVNNTGPLHGNSPSPPEPCPKDARLAELELENTRLRIQIENLQKAEENHQIATHRLQALFHHAPVAYVMLDEQGLMTDWNAAAEELLRRRKPGLNSGKPLSAMPLSMFVSRKDLYVFFDHFRRCKWGNFGQVTSELRLRVGRNFIPVQMLTVAVHSGGQRFFQTALVNLTERERIEEAVKEAKAFSDAIIQTMHEPLVVLNNELKVLRMNDAFGRLFGLDQSTARGTSLESILNLWWSGNELRTRLENCLNRHAWLTNFEFDVQPRNLGPRTFAFNARRLPLIEGTAALLVALEDITARKQAEKSIAESNRKLQELNSELEKRVNERTKELRESNRQLEGFCYSIAHDLRAPLRASAGFATILHDRFAAELGPRGAEYVGRIVAAGKQMDGLIRDLLEYGRFNTVEFCPAPIDADESLNWVISNLEPAIQEKHATIERRGRLPRVLGHKVALEAAFSNLIGNALKFVPPQTPPKVTIWPDQQGNNVTISVADNGIGIPSQYHQRIFDVFQRLHTQKDYPGTGIGLAIVSKAIQRLGGKVGVESEPGKGSRFWLTLPAAT